jgi:hypothetical protein
VTIFWTRFGTEDCAGYQGTKGRKQSKLPALIQMGGWCGAFDSDAKDYDITGAMLVTGDGNDIIRMPFYWQGVV